MLHAYGQTLSEQPWAQTFALPECRTCRGAGEDGKQDLRIPLMGLGPSSHWSSGALDVPTRWNHPRGSRGPNMTPEGHPLPLINPKLKHTSPDPELKTNLRRNVEPQQQAQPNSKT